MKIALISLNREKMPEPVIPIGLLSLMANIPSGHKTELWDLCFEDSPLDYLAQQERKFCADVFALSIRNIQNNHYAGVSHNISFYKEVIDKIREISEKPIVIGGSGFSVMPTKLMRHLIPDFGISGEGELSFPALLRYLETGKKNNLDEVDNLYYSRNEKIMRNDKVPGPFINMNCIEPPNSSRIDRQYLSFTGTANIQTQRGCQQHCTYCTYPAIEGTRKRSRDILKTVDEMEKLASKEEVRHIFIVDSVFNLPLSNCKELCRELIRRNFKTPWTSYVNPISWDREIAELMAEAGGMSFESGSDSGSDAVLLKLKKGFTTKEITFLSRTSKEAGIKDCHSFILGTPGETLDQVHETLEFIADLNPFAAILMVWVDDNESLNLKLARERRNFKEKVLQEINSLKDAFPRWIIPSLNVNFNEKLFKLMRRQGMAGPLWTYLDKQAW
jgi:radical SAM superfamily enzyme YgiQ (UPF0313 family)